MTDFEKSMYYEGQFGKCLNRAYYLQIARRKAAEKARESRKAFVDVYTPQLDRIKEEKKIYRKLSDAYYEKHKQLPIEFDEDAVIRLANAIVERAALDYEAALCKGNSKVITEVETFAKDNAGFYTRTDVERILARIRKAHKEFKQYAYDNIASIIETTDRINRKKKHNYVEFNDKCNHNRCPLCGMGLYIKKRYNGGGYLVACGGCSLTEAVTLKQ